VVAVKRILITGSRKWVDQQIVHDAILTEIGPHAAAIVIHGGASGADSIAHEWAEYFDGVTTEIHLADWDTHGKAAGPIRNQEMVDAGADVCLAFLKLDAENRGTKDCISRAEKAGIPVQRYVSA
jgi:hypothetical protein